MDAFRAAGNDVFLVDINEAAADVAVAGPLAGRARKLVSDLSQEGAPAVAVAAAIDAFGGLDTLFVNAAVIRSAPLAQWTREMWNGSIALNLSAPFFLTQAAAPYLARSANASIIFSSSTGAVRGHAGMPAYHATKTGLLGLCRALADELAPQRIRVNCIMPGWIDTPFNEPYWSFQSDRQAAEAALLRQIPMGRQGTPEDVAGVVTFLASPAARYVTGSSIVIDGGYLAV